MITMFGALGAAGAAVLSTTFRLMVTCWLARGLKGPRPQWENLAVILGAGVAVFALARGVELVLGSLWGVVGRLVLAVAFPCLLLLSPVFNRAERDALQRFVTARLSPPKDGTFQKVTL
jgi:hypothetical protein